MKSTFIKTVILSLSAVASISSFADGIGSKAFRDEPTASTKSRQEVRAELAQAIREGHTFYIDNSYPKQLAVTGQSNKTRQEVRAEIGANSGNDNPMYMH